MAISKLEEFSIRVIASWIKLLIIMHAEKKLVLRKESNLSWWILKFWLELLFSLKFTEGHLIADHQKIYPRSKIKTNTKNHEKSHFNLTTGQFLFSKYKTIKGLHILNWVCWIFDRRNLIFKNTFKNWHLSDFIPTIRLE
jgi:hypothetical protein